ncbi:hypothetical protein ANOM_006108 [Aspergillus nomiae NRRL 13137]|uniref:Uncharacterized protein n=1 Tax=Aspergillus nomiae NRRL (strain ATCC 15546 / NRRL 13137 / CBS 260.88 / M93) TaxID=1509407 RepID=A0A0L1J2T5_ASPN3|nr:uncharacterized protein ANOM_006108 [Aspergillus nomiae NRRL 13137]KNG85965.1 hypothetical protein ANOM_006108 [Aspergillus nomiae NRRL 13137]
MRKRTSRADNCDWRSIFPDADDRGETDEWCQSKSAEVEESSSPCQDHEELKHTLHGIPEEVPFNPEGVDVILIDDEEYPDNLKYEDTTSYYAEVEDHEVHRETDKSMHRVMKYLCNYAQNTPFGELSGPESWVEKGLYHRLRRADPDAVFRLYLAIIPESTHTILGHDKLTGQHILALPRVGPSLRENDAVIMILLDTFTPGSIAQFAVAKDQIDHLRSECGLIPVTTIAEGLDIQPASVARERQT